MFHQLYAFIISLCFITTTSEASRLLHHDKEHPYVVVLGSVYCHTCSQQTISTPNPTHHFISGVVVAVECANMNKAGTLFTKQVKTNEHGEFEVQLPFSSLNKIKKGCSVKLIGNNDLNCAGVLSFKPSNHPQPCNKKPKERQVTTDPLRLRFTLLKKPKPMLHNFKKMALLQVANNDDKMSKTQFGVFPPIPFLPPPTIVPPIIPSPPPSIFPPIVPAPPPSIFPPIFPSPPSPPPSIFPPIFPSPPSKPPLPSPSLPFPLPPLPPFPPFPGVPPAPISSSVSP